MKTRHRLLVVVVLCSVPVVVGVGGVGQTDADRGLTATVAEDDRAFLGLDAREPRLRNGHHRSVPLATVANRFRRPIVALDVRVEPGGGPTPPRPTSRAEWTTAAPLSVGEETTVVVDVTCGAGPTPSDRFAVAITATTATGTDVELARDVTVTCTGEPNRGVAGNGSDAGEAGNGTETGVAGNGSEIGVAANGTDTGDDVGAGGPAANATATRPG